jgi:hypothetical protein
MGDHIIKKDSSSSEKKESGHNSNIDIEAEQQHAEHEQDFSEYLVERSNEERRRRSSSVTVSNNNSGGNGARKEKLVSFIHLKGTSTRFLCFLHRKLFKSVVLLRGLKQKVV